MASAAPAVFRFSNCWTTDVVEAKTLAMFAYMLKATRVMEIGMFTGYGALSIAEVCAHPATQTPMSLDGHVTWPKHRPQLPTAAPDPNQLRLP
jgi:hypothetical protein